MERTPQTPPNSGFLLLAWGPNPCIGRLQRAREFQDEVEKACRKGDAYLAHETLRKLRPWEPQTRAQLQSSEGSLLTLQEELTMLETHVAKIFAKYPQLNHAINALPDISGTLLAKHIGSIRPHKAVPTRSAPALRPGSYVLLPPEPAWLRT